MNINQMMKQAQQLQAKVEKAQAELLEKEYTQTTQGITIKVNGGKEVQSIDIDVDLLEADNKEILEDMLVVAFNEVFNQVDDDSEAIMAKATGNMKIPGF